MLTSSIVAPNALNLLLPGNSKTSTTQPDSYDDVRARGNGTYEWNRVKVSKPQLESHLRKLANKEKSKRNFTITHDETTPVESMVYVMDVALRMKLNAVVLPPN